MNSKSGLFISKPISVWNRPLKANFKDLFKSLTKAVVQGASLNWIEASKSTIDALSALGFDRDPGQVAWLLIHRSIIKAMYILVEENIDLIKNSPSGYWHLREDIAPSPEELEVICQKLDFSLEQKELIIDGHFFENPKGLSIIEEIKVPFQQWLQGNGLTEAQAKAISNRLPSYFVFALNNEWRNRQSEYTCLIEVFDSPFVKASEREQAWSRYSAWLQKQIDEPMFYEAFSLRQIYIPLRTYVDAEIEIVEESKQVIDEDRRVRVINRKKKITERYIVDLETILEEWLDKNTPDDAIRIISGGPGSGKSSFARIFAAHQAEKNDFRVLFIPLYRFDLSSDLVQAIGDFISYEGFFTYNPLDSQLGESRLLLIFDGLDEFSMQGKTAADASQMFLQAVQRKVDRINFSEVKLKVLISSRELVVQANTSEFHKPQQVLHLLPYYLSNDVMSDLKLKSKPHPEDSVYSKIDKRQVDQRHQWWRLYGISTGLGYERMPKDLDRIELADITCQPLLNYLVALSFDRGSLDFASESNINSLYEDLLKSIYQRVWVDRPHPATKGISEDQFIRILEEIGLTAWHGDGRTTTIKEIELHCNRSGLRNILNNFQEGAKEGVARLLLAFYFRKFGTNVTGEDTFEFTHKSFGEYLAARRIIRGLQRIYYELDNRRNSYDRGWDERDALVYWIELCGPKAIDEYLYKILQNEVQLRQTLLVAEWQKMLSVLISFLLLQGWPLDQLHPRLSFQVEVRQSRNAGEALLTLLSICSNLTQSISNIDWPSLISFGEWLSHLQPQRSNVQNTLSMKCLTYLNLQNCFLAVKDLFGARLAFSNLEGADLSLANLKRADLHQSLLRRAILSGANLEETNLQGANLEGANLQHANLKASDLRRANLQYANLSEANMQYADLRNANLQGAKPQLAKLEGAKLNGTIWSDGTELKGRLPKKLTFFSK